MITDKIDGDIARARNLVTDFGKIADPIADKAITGMAFIGLSIIGDIWWWVTIVVLLREWSVTLLRLSVLKHVVIAGRQSGKIKTTLQALALGGLSLPLRDRRPAPVRLRDPGRRSLFYIAQVLPGRGRRDDLVVGLRVLPRRVAPARQAQRKTLTRSEPRSTDFRAARPVRARRPIDGSSLTNRVAPRFVREWVAERSSMVR